MRVKPDAMRDREALDADALDPVGRDRGEAACELVAALGDAGEELVAVVAPHAEVP